MDRGDAVARFAYAVPSLDSYWRAIGRRSGDQFCVYGCDRFVVPHLSDHQQAQIGDGVISLDALTRQYIHDHFEYRYVTVGSGQDAFALEREVQRGALSVGKPFLNPIYARAGQVGA